MNDDFDEFDAQRVGFRPTMCAYCREAFEDIRPHILVCPKHPLAILKDQIRKFLDEWLVSGDASALAKNIQSIL